MELGPRAVDVRVGDGRTEGRALAGAVVVAPDAAEVRVVGAAMGRRAVVSSSDESSDSELSGMLSASNSLAAPIRCICLRRMANCGCSNKKGDEPARNGQKQGRRNDML